MTSTTTSDTFSTGVHQVLLSLSSKFGSNIHDAYQSDPSMNRDDPFEGNKNGALLEIQANKRAIDVDMKILHSAQAQGRVAVNDYLGYRKLGHNTYLDLMDDLFDDDDDDDNYGKNARDGRDYSCATYSDVEDDQEEFDDEDDEEDEDDEGESDDDEDDEEEDSSEFDSDSEYDSDWDSEFEEEEFESGFEEMMNAMASHGFVVSVNPIGPSPNMMSSIPKARVQVAT